MTNEIPRWKVQAALRLLGFDPADANEVKIVLDINKPYVDYEGRTIRSEPRIVDTVEDTRLHVLGIDPETGNAEISPVPDDDVTFFCGANMYPHSGTLHRTGTKMPVFKRRS